MAPASRPPTPNHPLRRMRSPFLVCRPPQSGGPRPCVFSAPAPLVLRETRYIPPGESRLPWGIDPAHRPPLEICSRIRENPGCNSRQRLPPPAPAPAPPHPPPPPTPLMLAPPPTPP